MKVVLGDGPTSFWPLFHSNEGAVCPPLLSSPFPPRDDAAQAKWLRGLLRARVRRGIFFSPRLFADPAWDMLLELYAAQLEQKRVSVSSLGIASGVPPTTALRWIAELQKDGFIMKQKDPLDARRTFVDLSLEGARAMRDYLASLPPSIYPFASQEASGG